MLDSEIKEIEPPRKFSKVEVKEPLKTNDVTENEEDNLIATTTDISNGIQEEEKERQEEETTLQGTTEKVEERTTFIPNIKDIETTTKAREELLSMNQVKNIPVVPKIKPMATLQKSSGENN